MSWTLAPNLQKRVTDVQAVYPHMVFGEVGDPKHQDEKSDHNPDTRGIVHAIDIMTETDTANEGAAATILAWLLAWTDDLQYVIHDRVIYGRDERNGWSGSHYDGADPHTNHIHASGKHGSVGKNAATGTGYDVAAEQMTPEPLEDYMPLNADDKAWIAAEIKAAVAANNAAAAEAVWTDDTIPNWRSDKATNPNMQARNALGFIGAASAPPGK